jgi:hypothetical protein
MLTKTLIEQISVAINARGTCAAFHNNGLWFDIWTERLEHIARNVLPSGSGIDCKTKIDLDASRDDCIVMHAPFHHMNENGMYDGWTEHTLRVRPSFVHGFTISISGRDRNDIKDYLHEVYEYALRQPYEFLPMEKVES